MHTDCASVRWKWWKGEEWADFYCFSAIGLLKERDPGAFVIRDSHSFRGAYGLAMKVASPPPTVNQNKKGKCSWRKTTMTYCIPTTHQSLMFLMFTQRKNRNITFYKNNGRLNKSLSEQMICQPWKWYTRSMLIGWLTVTTLLLQAISPMSWWGTSWLRAAPKEWSWRVVPMSLTLVSVTLPAAVILQTSCGGTIKW